MFIKKVGLPLLALLFNSLFLSAQGPADSLQMVIDEMKARDSIEKTLDYKTGPINLPNGIASINVPDGFKFLEAEQAKFVVEDIWGNLKGQSPLGLLFPVTSGATDPGGYAFVVQYDDIGYVKDGDADKIKYEDLLKEMKKESIKDNEERKKAGLHAMDLVGWAAKPYYDKEKKVLHWAKEFDVEDYDINTLNYDIRILGRKGVLILQAVAGMDQLDSVNRNIENVLSMVSFNEGHRYADFDSKTDNIAAWTIGGLVAGKILAKVGFFALILKNIKLVIVGIIAFGGVIWKFITGRRRKKEEEELVYAPASSPDNTSSNNPAA